MILTVVHKTRYEFATPVGGIIQSLRLTPARCEGQKIVNWSVDVPGAVIGGLFSDGAGDHIQTVSLRNLTSTVEVNVSGKVETQDMAGVLRGHRERVPPRAYMRNTPRTEPNRAIRELVEDTLAVMGTASALDRAHALASAVHKALPYTPGATHAHTTAAEAMNEGLGVCQDHTHVMIACAHLAGLPARYVSGYLNATEDGSPHEASHAWAEIYIDGLGWVGFDASNESCPNDHYIRLGSGLDAQDAAPIRGLVLGGAEESLDVTVVIEAQQQ
ncbi:MAG: transglutaminase family protein [Rhodobacteraceae bacterium]|nr:MAG: transglutaminase family protein [Paracoccaceae bacterium]